MLPEKQRKTNIGVGIGLLLSAIGFVLTRQEDPAGSIGFLLILLSVGPFTWGCMNYAEGKGHSKWVGLVGVAGIIGLIVLIVLPDQHKSGR
jgi:drug/metabolite transporter (DMT)-like permease